jgi:hypothetical protein
MKTVLLALTFAAALAVPAASAPDRSANSLLKRAKRVTVFARSDEQLWTGYHWISPTEIVFQRKGGYVQRDVRTGAEKLVQGYPGQGQAYSGNLMAEFTADGAWMLYHGSGDGEGDDGSLQVSRVDGAARGSWPAGKFPDLIAAQTYWLGDNATWVCPAYTRQGRFPPMASLIVGSVGKPGVVRRIPFARGAGRPWDVIAATRDRLLAIPMPAERKPPPVSRVRITELVLGAKVTLGPSYVLRFRRPAHAFCEDPFPRGGRLLWTLVLRGSPYTGERPLVTAAAVSTLGRDDLRVIGRITTRTYRDDDEPAHFRWHPDGRRISFLYRRGLYVAPVD